MSASASRELPAFMEVRDFLEWPGDGLGGQYELADGVLRAMAPGSSRDATIQANLAHVVMLHLNHTSSPCRVLTKGGVIPPILAEANYRIPDLVVTCAADAPQQVAVPDPVVVVEILSPGNDAATRSNVWTYATIASVREIVLVHSTRIAVEIWRRGADGAWPDKAEKLAEEDTPVLESIGFGAPVREAYRRTYLLDGNAA